MMDELLNARPGTHSRTSSYGAEESSGDRGINFTMFLTMMSERLFEFDTEAELLEAFESFDENDSGMVKVEEMRKWLSDMGDRMDDREASYTSRFYPEFTPSRSIDCSKDHLQIDKATSTIVNGSRYYECMQRTNRRKRKI